MSGLMAVGGCGWELGKEVDAAKKGKMGHSLCRAWGQMVVDGREGGKRSGAGEQGSDEGDGGTGIASWYAACLQVAGASGRGCAASQQQKHGLLCQPTQCRVGQTNGQMSKGARAGCHWTFKQRSPLDPCHAGRGRLTGRHAV